MSLKKIGWIYIILAVVLVFLLIYSNADAKETCTLSFTDTEFTEVINGSVHQYSEYSQVGNSKLCLVEVETENGFYSFTENFYNPKTFHVKDFNVSGTGMVINSNQKDLMVRVNYYFTGEIGDPQTILYSVYLPMLQKHDGLIGTPPINH